MAHGGHAEPQTTGGSPEAEEDLPFQQPEWTIQRIGWIAMTLLVLAALLGLTGGGGPLTSATQRTRDNTLQMDYLRVERAQAPAELRFEVATGSGDQVSIWIGNEFLSRVKIESISPQPLETHAGDGRQLFIFPVAGDAGSIEATFHYRPLEFGMYSGSTGIIEGEAMVFDLLVVP